MKRPFLRAAAFFGAVLIILYYDNVLFGLPGADAFRTAPSPILSGVLALILIYALYVGISGDVAIWNAVVGEDGRASTSKLQILLWTAAAVFGYVAVATHRIQLGLDAPLPGFPAGLLGALGLSVGTATAAAAVTSTNVNAGRELKTLASNLGPGPLVQSDDGMPSLTKIQLIGWTMVGIGMFFAALATTLSLTITADVDKLALADKLVLPDIDPTLLVLMGLGSAAYIGSKLVPSNSVQIANISQPMPKPGDTVTVSGVNFGSAGFVKMGNEVIGNTQSWSDTAITFAIPAARSDGSAWAVNTPMDLSVFGSAGPSVNSKQLTIMS